MGHKFGENSAGIIGDFHKHNKWVIGKLNGWIYSNMSNIKLMMNTKVAMQLLKKCFWQYPSYLHKFSATI